MRKSTSSKQLNITIKKALFAVFIFSIFLFSTNTKAATIYFNNIYKATGNTYTVNTQSLAVINVVSGTGFKFTSADPTVVLFSSGNNENGILSFTNSSGVYVSIYGKISRQSKSGNTTLGVNFIPSDATYTSSTGEAYLLVIPGKETSYIDGGSASTSSDPIDPVLNDLLTVQASAPVITLSSVSVLENAGYAVFTVSLSNAASANITFTPTLTNVTAFASTDYTNSMQYYNGSTWVNITTTVSIAQNDTSLQIRVPILNYNTSSTNKTFNLNTGAITGGNVLNNSGTYGIGTILVPVITKTGTLSAFTSCSGLVSAEQSFSVSGANLVSDLTVTAPTGYEVSLTSGGTFTNSVALTQTTNTVNSTTIYVRLKNNASNAASGNVVCSATSAVSANVSTGTATVNTSPSSPTGTDGSRNGTGTVSISGAVTTGETIDWYANSTGGSPLSGGTGTTSFTTPSVSSTTIYYAQARNTTTGCISASRTAVTATILTGGATPTLSSSGSLTNFAACSGIVSSEQSFTISGVDLVSNITITAPTGYEVSLTSGGTFTDSVDLMPTSNTVSTTTTYIRLKSNASNGASGNVVCSATNATSENVSVGTATVNALPSSPTGTDGSRYGTGTVSISGAVNSGETIDWYANSTGGSPLSSGTGTTSFTTPSISSTTIYYAQARNTTTGCVSTSRTAVTATVLIPTISTSGTLSAFTACVGTVSSEQNFSVSGINLVSNITITAPTGYEVSLTSGGTFTDSVDLMPTSNTVSTTTTYIRLKSNASNGASGNVVCSATNATSENVSVGTATVNALPSISGTLTVCVGATTQLTGSATAAVSSAWVSATTGVATISDTGLVTGQSSGTSLITYTNSNGCIITSTVTVNALPSITLASSATDVAYDVNGQNTSITYSGATGSPTTYSIAWNSSPSNSFVAVSDTNLTSSPISLAIPAGTAVGTYTGTFTVKNVLQCTNSYSFTVKINDVIAPIITHPTSTTLNTCSLTLSENTSGVTIYTANETVTWSITGGDDQAKFSISPTGSLTFIAPYPIHAYPTDTAPTNSYIVEITATDSAGNYSRQLLTVNISPFCGNWGN